MSDFINLNGHGVTNVTPPEDDTAIRYSVKELLGDIKSSIERVYGKLDAKADRTEVDALSRKVDHINDRINEVKQEVEHRKRSENEITEWKRWIVPSGISVAILVVAVLQFIKG